MSGAPLPGVGAVVVAGDRLLLVLRGRGALRGHWAVPGGRQRYGETMRDAVRREVLEETGYEVEVGDPVWAGDVIGPGDPPAYHYAIVDFRAEVVGGSARAGDDALEVRWVDRSEVRRLRLTPTMEELLDGLGW